MFFASSLLVSLFYASVGTTADQEQSQTNAVQGSSKPVAIEPGKPLEETLQGGEKRIYEIHVESGLFLHAVVEQLGIDVALRLYAPDGEPIASMDSPNGNFGSEKISTITEAPGVYKLEVAAVDRNVPVGRYRVTLDPPRVPDDQDRARISAERTFFEAVHLSALSTADSRRDAIQKYAASLPIWRAAGDSYEEALTQYAIADICDRLGERQKALGYYAGALTLQRAIGDRPGEAATLDSIGTVYNALGVKQKALDSYNLCLPLERAVGDRPGEAITLGRIGQIYNDLGEKQQSLNYHNQALLLKRALGDQYEEAVSLNNIGMVYSDLGEKQKALDYYNQSLALERVLGNRSGEASTLANIGLVYSDLGEKQKALNYYSLALSLHRALGNQSGEAVTLNNIGSVFHALGAEQRALDHYSLALPLLRAIGDRFGEAAILANIGTVYRNLGEKQKALEYFNQALPLNRALGDRPGEAVTLTNIGRVYNDLGGKQKALDYLSQALPLHREVGSRSGEAATLDYIGRVYYDLEKKQKALEYYNQSLALFRALLDPLGQAGVLSDLMRTWRDQKQPEIAVFFGKQAVNEIQQIRANIRGLEKETQQSFLKAQANTYRLLADILIAEGRLPEAQRVLEILKNEEYFEFIRRDDRQAASLTAPMELTKKEKELSNKYAENAASVTSVGNEWATLRAKPARTPEEEKHLAELTGQLKIANQAWSKFLDDLHLEMAKSKQPQTTVENLQENASGLQRVVRQLGAGTVALYTLVGEEKYHVILVTANVQVAREYTITSGELNAKVAAYRDALLDPHSDPVPKAQELYKILVGPVAKDLEGAQATTLMWSLDGVLRYIPLAALYDGHEYLVEKYRNIVFTPASIPELAARPTVTHWSGLAMGVSKSYGGMSTLPAVPAELHAIIRETGTAESAGVMTGHTMLDDSFTEDNLKQALLQKYPLIHIASHFVFGAGNDTDSYLLLGGKEAGGQRLTLAELNADPDISFNDVELLTLSACNTALSIPGDGREVDGLGILAQRKGAKAVMATLWSVYDPSTSLLMQTFYRNWTTGLPLSKAEALRRAQLALLHGGADQTGSGSKLPYAHPYYWAPFILIGNWQ
jgi:CHAT domain-containing protein/Tfp pilus assembly protein PilF